eukprot:6463869-Amphidinium_carterae.2
MQDLANANCPKRTRNHESLPQHQHECQYLENTEKLHYFIQKPKPSRLPARRGKPSERVELRVLHLAKSNHHAMLRLVSVASQTAERSRSCACAGSQIVAQNVGREETLVPLRRKSSNHKGRQQW